MKGILTLLLYKEANCDNVTADDTIPSTVLLSWLLYIQQH